VRSDPFATSVVLVGKDGPSSPLQTGLDGTYSFADVAAGDYELYVLLSATPAKIAGCTDVVVPSGWVVGWFIGSALITVVDATTLQQGIDNFSKNGLTGPLYAGSPKMTLTPAKTLRMDVVLTCN
jgi:predicted ABC-type sugar transport system permease subunit